MQKKPELTFHEGVVLFLKSWIQCSCELDADLFGVLPLENINTDYWCSGSSLTLMLKKIKKAELQHGEP